MKRLAGSFKLDGSPAGEETIRRMLAAMQAHQDGETLVWADGPAGLGCSSPHEAKGNNGEPTPADRPGKPHRICFDGRIDNREDLCSLLNMKAADTDDALVLAAYAKWELDCAARLLGDFAFAIWDGIEQQMFCARDPFGVRPFYYSLDQGCFSFASTAPAVPASGLVPGRVNEGRIADYLLDTLEGYDKQVTFYEGVVRLPPGHTLLVRRSGAVLSRYWELTPHIAPASYGEAELVEAFGDLLREAVDCRMRSGNEQASMLSGGIDSCSIVAFGRALLSSQGRRQLATFSAVDDSQTGNRETGFIRQVTVQGGLDATLFDIHARGPEMDALIMAIENEDDPFDGLMNLPRMTYLLAGQRGFSAVMDGLDGDLLLGRADYIAPLWRSGQVRAALGETLTAGGVTAALESRQALLYKSLRSAFTPGWMRSAWHRQRRARLVDSKVKSTLISRGFAEQANISERQRVYDIQRKLSGARDHISAHKMALTHADLTAALERYERTAAGQGIEARHPLLDVRLASFCLGLPWQMKTHRGWTKRILRMAASPLLPEPVVWRADKDQLMWAFNLALLQQHADRFQQACLDERETLSNYIDITKLERVWRSYRRDGGEESAGLAWQASILGLWLRRLREHGWMAPRNGSAGLHLFA